MLIQPQNRYNQQYSKPPSGELLSVKDRLTSQRLNDFMVDPGPINFRHETVAEAQRYMADKLKEFDYQFGLENTTNRQ
jgi:putative SOS response-associated peptidase YedK